MKRYIINYYSIGSEIPLGFYNVKANNAAEAITKAKERYISEDPYGLLSAYDSMKKLKFSHWIC